MIQTDRRPRWFMAAAIASLLFMLLGCIGLALHVMTDPATLPLDQRAQMEALPIWVFAAWAVAIVAGALGALLLVLRRPAADPLLLISAVAVIIWFVGMFVSPEFRPLMTTSDVVIAIVVSALTCLVFAFARRSRQQGWLR